MDFFKKKANDIPLRTDRVAFLVFFAVFALTAWNVTRPMLTPIIWAALLAYLVHPIYRRIRKIFREKYPSAAVLITIIIVALVTIIPFGALLVSLGKEATAISAIVAGLTGKIAAISFDAGSLPAWVPEWGKSYILSFFENTDSIKDMANTCVQWFAGQLTAHSAAVIRSTASFVFYAFMTLMISFFLIRDGEGIMDYIYDSLPLSAKERIAFAEKTKLLMRSIVFGVLITVFVQSLLGTLGWWYVGLSNPAFFGALMFFCGMIPVGTALVWGPGSLYLLATGNIKGGIILLIWGSCVVSTIDNFLRPMIISGQSDDKNDIPTFLVIIGLCGGLSCWGIAGVFFGPIVLILFKLILDIYKDRCEKEAELEEANGQKKSDSVLASIKGKIGAQTHKINEKTTAQEEKTDNKDD